jgi:hypothetical protein
MPKRTLVPKLLLVRTTMPVAPLAPTAAPVVPRLRIMCETLTTVGPEVSGAVVLGPWMVLFGAIGEVAP